MGTQQERGSKELLFRSKIQDYYYRDRALMAPASILLCRQHCGGCISPCKDLWSSYDVVGTLLDPGGKVNKTKSRGRW